MNKSNKDGIKRYFHFGFSSILLTFVMICIVTFGVLSFVTANSDYKLSEKVATKVSGYYDADSAARMELATIDHTLYDLYYSSASESEYYEQVQKYLGSAAGTYTESSNSRLYTWQESFSDTQAIEITLQINYPTSTTDHFYEIQSWRTITNAVIDTETTLNLMGD